MSMKKDVFNNFQKKIAYYKWLLVYRLIIIQELGININDTKLESCIEKIRGINKIINTDICNKCKYKDNCIVEPKIEN